MIDPEDASFYRAFDRNQRRMMAQRIRHPNPQDPDYEETRCDVCDCLPGECNANEESDY